MIESIIYIPLVITYLYQFSFEFAEGPVQALCPLSLVAHLSSALFFATSTILFFCHDPLLIPHPSLSSPHPFLRFRSSRCLHPSPGPASAHPHRTYLEIGGTVYGGLIETPPKNFFQKSTALWSTIAFKK